MYEIIDRIGIPLFIQVVLEIWNGVFLLLMILSICIRIPYEKNEATRNIKIPYTREIVVFYDSIFLYNLFNVMGIIMDGSDAAISYWFVRIFGFLYYAVGAFQTLFFLQLIKKHIAEKNGKKRLVAAAFAVQMLQLPALALLVITPYTGVLYSFDELNRYIRGPMFLWWHATSIISFLFIIIVYVIERKKRTDFFVRSLSQPPPYQCWGLS